LTSDDIARDWETLIDWARDQRPAIVEEISALDKELGETESGRRKIVAKLEEACAGCQVTVAEGGIVEAVVEAHTSAQHERDRIAKAIEQAAKTRAEIAAKRSEYEIAHQLGLHLSAKPGNFVPWLVNVALERLVEGATEILRELSNDQYELRIDELGTFYVTDRHNAGEPRSARTLSGGETFLASLSLALSLADHLAELAEEGAARLEAIFLDEGFGTLDPDTLATVAATVENLAADGRMVGVVTHVRELADEIPTKFRITKDLKGSRVEKVVA
jgi:exonuclease SbcC